MIKGTFKGPSVPVLSAYVIVTEPVMAKVTIPNEDPTRESVDKSMLLYISGIRETTEGWFLVEGTTEDRHPIKIKTAFYKMEKWSIEIDNEVSA